MRASSWLRIVGWLGVVASFLAQPCRGQLAEGAKLITAIDEPTEADKSQWAGQWQGPQLERMQVERACRTSARLKYPQKTVAVATATHDGAAGCVVLDGPRSRWYPASQFPDGTHPDEILRIHVGRQLLGLDDEPDRRQFFVPPPPPRGPAQIVAAYEKLLVEATQGDEHRRVQLLMDYASPLDSHFDRFASAFAATQNISKDEAIIATCDRLLAAAQALPEAKRTDAAAGKSRRLP